MQLPYKDIEEGSLQMVFSSTYLPAKPFHLGALAAYVARYVDVPQTVAKLVSFDKPTVHTSIFRPRATAIFTSDTKHPMQLLLLPTCLNRETFPSALQRMFVNDVMTSWVVTQL
jgi:hypothetical protein